MEPAARAGGGGQGSACSDPWGTPTPGFATPPSPLPRRVSYLQEVCQLVSEFQSLLPEEMQGGVSASL